MSSLFFYDDPKRYEDLILKQTLGLLEKHFGYNYPKLIGNGAFGVVIQFKVPQAEDVAIKCLFLDDASEGELNFWIRLRHPNIVPLLGKTVFEPLNMACFEMQFFPVDLMSAVQQNDYLESPEALQKLKSWLYQVLCALDYLHKKQLCHLNLKSQNVFVSQKESRAMIGDFSLLSSASSKIERDKVGLPQMYRPPEASWLFQKVKFLDGQKFDMWSFGIMSFELLTDFHMLQCMSCCYLGTDARYASIRGALQEEAFTSKMQTALPAVEITGDDVQMSLNFIHSFLKIDPPSRLTAAEGMQHTFLEKGDVVNAEVDELWKQPDATIQGLLGLKVPLNKTRVTKQGGGVKKWFRRRCSSLYRLFTKCLPCV